MLTAQQSNLSGKGKPISSAAVGRLSSVRLSATPLLLSRVRARLGVDFRGGKTRRWNGHNFINVLAQGGLVVFDGQQIVRSVLQHQLPGGLILGVKGVQSHRAPRQIQLAKEFTGHRDLVGLGVDQRAAQVKLAGQADGTEDRLAGAQGALRNVEINVAGMEDPRAEPVRVEAADLDRQSRDLLDAATAAFRGRVAAG